MLNRHHWRSTLEVILIPLAALSFSLFLLGVFCVFLGKNPFEIYGSIYSSAFGNWRSWQSTLLRASPLMLSALCTALPARLGLGIIGNEGAIVVGGLGAVSIALAISTAPAIVIQMAMAIAGMICGGVWIALSGALRHYRGINETISSLLLNYIAIALLNHLVNGPMRDPSSLNKPSSFPIPDIASIGSIPGTRVHYGLIYGLVACAITYFLMQHTTFGFAARTAGGNVKAARIAGLPVGKLTILTCFIAGSCAGLAGMIEVAAVHKTANESLSAGYGYAGILVAFVARHNPLAASLVSILLGGILASGSTLQRTYQLPDATVLLFQGIVFLVILYSESLYGKFKLFKDPPETIAPPPAATTSTAV